MLVTSNNLSKLVAAEGVCPEHLVEEYSLCIRLDGLIRRMRQGMRQGSSDHAPIIYGSPFKSADYFSDLATVDRELFLSPGDRVLCCSRDRYTIPCQYFGLVQTKGSLARLFVSATCNDGQVEPGFSGKITLEITNMSNFPIILPVGAKIAQMFLFRCTTTAKPYAGRYQNADEPTIADFSAAGWAER